MTLHCANPSCSATIECPEAHIGSLTAIGRHIRPLGWMLDVEGELWCERCRRGAT